jgi:hypothetical protein
MAAGLQMSLKSRLFFDRGPVVAAVDKAGQRALSRQAARLRLTAQRSMRYVSAPKSGKPRKVSSPGQPPRAVRPHPWLRKHLYYSWDPSTKSAVVGPALFGPASGAPHTQEFGGRVTIRNPRRKRRQVGAGGEIDIGGSGPTSKPAYNWRGEKIIVRYAKLRTPSQVAHANEIQAWLYGPETFAANIEPRPYMGPALAKILPQLPRELAGSVRP